MLEYVTDNLRRAAYERYPETWGIVSSPQAILLMREMATIGHPAVDTLHHIPDLCRLILYIDFRDSDWSDSVRQLIGHMCRQVMEQLGYTKIQDDAPIFFSNIFQGGAVYRWNEH